MDWRTAAAAVKWNIRPFIDGRYHDSTSEKRFENINPATETPLCEVAVGSDADVDDAVRAARRSFDDGRWSDLAPARRMAVLQRLAELIVEHRSRLALLDSLEIGKPIRTT